MTDTPRRVRDYPIIFSGGMVRALLEGRKTQTRRLAGKWRVTGDPASPQGETGVFVPSPWQRVQPGDRLWVREGILQTLAATQDPCGEWRSYWTNERVEYLADEPAPVKRHLHPNRYCSPYMQSRPSIHMQRWASRLTLTVTAVRIERLQDISEADARAEGAPLPDAATSYREPHRLSFAALWDHLHGAGAWEANPEVVALSFTVARENIDAHQRCEAGDG